MGHGSRYTGDSQSLVALLPSSPPSAAPTGGFDVFRSVVLVLWHHLLSLHPLACDTSCDDDLVAAPLQKNYTP